MASAMCLLHPHLYLTAAIAGSSEGLLSPKSFPTIYNASCVVADVADRGLMAQTSKVQSQYFSTESSLTCSMNLLQEDKHNWYLSDEELDAILPATSMNSLQEDNHNHYLSDEELDAILPATGYDIVTPPPGYAPMEAPCKLMGLINEMFTLAV
ncbi:hypothetical protein BDR07DRAFT_1483726 [Suillus spraguei]|nr:hypothetical protein BDR07DRAFT_1483726 [Suillus spraguei]